MTHPSDPWTEIHTHRRTHDDEPEQVMRGENLHYWWRIHYLTTTTADEILPHVTQEQMFTDKVKLYSCHFYSTWSTSFLSLPLSFGSYSAK